MTDILAINDNEPQPEDMETVVRGFLAEGKIIDAVKYVRSAATLDLANAKIYVDSIAAKIRDEGIVGEGQKYLKQSENIARLQAENAQLRASLPPASTHPSLTEHRLIVILNDIGKLCDQWELGKISAGKALDSISNEVIFALRKKEQASLPPAPTDE